MNHTNATARKGWAAAAVFLLAFSQALALEPPTKEQVDRYRRDGTLAARAAKARSYGNHRIAPRLVTRTGERLRQLALEAEARKAGLRPPARLMAPPPNWTGMPTRGTVKVLALLIAFSDYPGTTPPATFASRLFGDGQGGPPFASLRNYYRRSSYNQLEIGGTTLGWYRTAYPRSSVTSPEAVIEEALSSFDATTDFSQYDNDGDGTIDENDLAVRPEP